MVMIARREIERVIANPPDRGSTAYRNAWATVRARLKSSKNPKTIQRLGGFLAALAEIGEPFPAPPRIPQTEALARGRDAMKARAVGRCRAAIMRRLDANRWGVVSVTSEKPFMWEAALQMVEDCELAYQRCAPIGTQGPEAADGREKGMRIWLVRPHMSKGEPCPYRSERAKAVEERI